MFSRRNSKRQSSLAKNVNTSALKRAVVETLEDRRLLAAHILGSTVVYSTIQSAVNAAAAGATITVDAGTYNETVTVNKSLTINGSHAGVNARTARPGAETIVYATQTVFSVKANDVTIDGFTIEGNDANIGASWGAGVLMAPSIHGTHVLNNIIQNNVDGIYLSNNSNTDLCLIQGNLIQNNFESGNNWPSPDWNGSCGIYTDGSVTGGYLTNVLINNNTLYNSNFNGGAEFQGMISLAALTANKQFNITVSNNMIGNESKALLAFNVTNLTWIGNTCNNLNDGSSGPVRFEGDANNVNIQYNSIFNNGGPGVAEDNSGVPGDSSGFVVNNNNLYQNDGIGVLLADNCYDGTLTAVGDYWGSPSGPSGDGPGTGQAVWANGTSGHGQTPKGLPGGSLTFSPWATSLINISNIPVPAAPIGLTAGSASATQITLNWTEPMSTAISQLVQRSTDGVNFSTIATLPPMLNTYVDGSVTTGQGYYYRVIASNYTGNSSPSNVLSTVPPVYQPPVAPSGLVTTGTTGSSVSLAWSAPTYTVGVTGYTIYRNGISVGTSAVTSFTDNGLTSSTAYTYTVATDDSTGAISAPGNAIVATTAVAQFADPSFELTRETTYAYNPVTANWIFASSSGIEANGSAFGAANAPNGTQGAFLQGNGAALGNFSQSVNAGAGIYTISFSAAQRAGYGLEPIAVKADGVLVGTITPASSSFASYITPSFKLTSGAHTFSFAATLGNGDCDSFVDALSLNYVSAATAPLAPTHLAGLGIANAAVALSWLASGAAPASFTLQRSTDNVNFATLTSAISGNAVSYIDSSSLAASTTYYYQLIAVNAAGSSPASNVATVTTVSAYAPITPLSKLTWTGATSGWKTPQLNSSVAGNVLTLKGVTYASGIGTHAASTITYALAGAYTVFQSDIGIDDEEKLAGTGSVDFQVVGDGKVLFDSGVLTNASPTVSIAISVAGVKTLSLVATNGIAGNIDYDHADWAGALLIAPPAPTAAPTNLVASATSSTSVRLSWVESTTGITSYVVQRSTDGKTFSTIAPASPPTSTFFTDNTVVAGTTYYYTVQAVGPTGTSVVSAVAIAATPSAASIVTNLSSLNWTSATTGWGTVQKNLSIGGNVLTLRGVTYVSGIGTHAASTIVYNLAGGYTNFLSDIGVDDEELGKGAGSVDFQVVGDGKVLFDSGLLSTASPTVSVNVNVSGVQTLTLLATNGVAGSIDFDHADWAGARLLSNPQVPSAPAALAAVALSASSIKLSWTPPTSVVTAYAIDRSTDGIAFTNIVSNISATAVNWTDPTTLAGNTTYYYQIRAINAVGPSVNSTIASATTLSTTSVATALSSLTPVSATTGWGSVQTNTSVSGNPITLRGVTYASGVGTHAASQIVYNLAGGYTNFISDIGVDDEVNGKGTGSVDFQIIGDGKVLYDSGALTNTSAVVSININVTGIQSLTLVATNGIVGSIDYDHADWAGAKLISTPAPVVGAAKPAVKVAAIKKP